MAMALKTSFIPNQVMVSSVSSLPLCRISMASAPRSSSYNTTKMLFTPPGEPCISSTYSMPPEKREIFYSLNDWSKENILTLLKHPEESWQPTDFLPDPTSEGFHDQVQELRERAKDLPDDFFVALVGYMITEEALPTYQSLMNTMDGIKDETGSSLTPWATWIRTWTSEENRHGDLLNKYLYLSGRVDMRQIEKTIQYLSSYGMDAGTENNPYLGFIYGSFQERATFISHGNTARLAKHHGDAKLAQICGTIAADEKRHENAYTKIVGKLFEVDPDTTMQALGKMMRWKIVMPAHFMYDGRDEHLYDHFAAVSQRLGVYAVENYANIIEHFMSVWDLERMTDGLTGEGRRAQEYVCGLPPRIRRLEERTQKPEKSSAIGFSWVFGREIAL